MGGELRRALRSGQATYGVVVVSTFLDTLKGCGLVYKDQIDDRPKCSSSYLLPNGQYDLSKRENVSALKFPNKRRSDMCALYMNSARTL